MDGVDIDVEKPTSGIDSILSKIKETNSNTINNYNDRNKELFHVTFSRDDSSIVTAIKRFIYNGRITKVALEESFKSINNIGTSFDNFKKSLNSHSIDAKTEKRWCRVLGIRIEKVVIKPEVI